MYGKGATYSYNGILSISGVQLGVSYSENISAEIPANPKKYSKLALYGYFDLIKYEQKIYVTQLKALDYKVEVNYRK